MPFALTNDPSQSEISEAINYLLANFGANLSVDPNNGQITGSSGIIIAYFYQYLAVKYADSYDGTVNFSNSPTGRTYYGLRNTDSSVESTNPADYIWYQAAGGFGTTKFLFYQTGGGRQINFVIATTSPGTSYVQESGPAIDLDVVTNSTATGAAAAAQATANTALANAATADATANTALTTANNKLSKIGADVLQGPISLNTASTILVGTTTTGVAIGTSGIIGRKAGVTTFSVANTGDAIFAGDILTEGDAQFNGKNFENSYPITVGGVSYSIDYSAYAEATSTPTAGVVRSGLLGVASASSGLYNVGVIGYGQNGGASLGIGVVGQGNHIGGSFSSSSVTGAGVYCENTNPTGAALWIATGRFKWGGYSIIAPAGSTTTFLRNDGTWATPSGGATPAGANTQIQYNNSGAFGASYNLTFSGSALNAFGVDISAGNGSHFTNIAIGANSLISRTSGQYNVATGYEALRNTTSGGSNTAYGYNALKTNTTSSFNTAVGYAALQNSTGDTNTAVGYNAASSALTGSGNVAVGSSALTSCTSGQSNVAVGNFAGYSSTTGGSNICIGLNTNYTNTSGDGNIAIGSNSLRYNTASNNIGIRGLYANTSGSGNTGIDALASNTIGYFNVGVGYGAINSNISGSSNVGIGVESLGSTTSDSNTAIGRASGDTNTTGTNNSFIGYQARGASATTSNNITLGNSSITTLRCQVTSITALSDARDKTNIKPIQSGLDFVKKLNPVSFTWNTRDGAKVGLPDMGFIAQELVDVQNQTQVIPNLVSHENPEKLEAAYGTMFPILIKAVQELTAKVEALEAQLKA